MDSPLLYLATVVGLGIAAQWLAWRMKLPAILLLLAFGFGLGRFVPPDRHIDESLLFSVVSLSVAVILFEGGLTLRYSDLRDSGNVTLRLVTVGCLVTWVLATLAGRLVFSTWGMAAIAGGLYTVTGPTVIGPLLRHVRPARRVGSIAKWEGIVIDPIGALLAVLVFDAVFAGSLEQAAPGVFTSLVKTLAVAIVFSFGLALLYLEMVRRHWAPDYLENPIMFALVMVGFAVSNALQHEAGLATVTLLGIILANQRIVTMDHLVEFKENLGVLLVSILFILLASRLTLEDLTALGISGLLFLAAMILIVRPASILAATYGSPLNRSERCFLAWLAPRGIVAAAVASVFAIRFEGLHANGQINDALAADAARLEPLTFLVIVGTVIVYGLTSAPLARRLRISDPEPQGILFAGASPLVRAIARVLLDEGFAVKLIDTNRHSVAAARLQGLRARHANILSEYLQENLDLGGIGRLLAMTPNGEVNALAAAEFVSFFGRQGVYQLAPDPQESARLEISSKHRQRFLFGPHATFQELDQRFAEGATIKKTRLTDEFDYHDFVSLYGDKAIVMFTLSDGKLSVRTIDSDTVPKPGTTLISLVDPMPDDNENSSTGRGENGTDEESVQ